MQILRPRC